MSLTGFVRARLSRVIFAWFAISIAVTTGIVAAAVATYIVAGGQSHWHMQIERGERFVGNQLAGVWDHEDKRKRVLQAVGNDLGLQIELHDHDHQLLDRAGPEVCDARKHTIEIARQGTALGTASLCDPFQKSGKAVFFWLLLFGFVLWAASAVVASRITRPLRGLTAAATDFGSGDLRARAPVISDESELAELSRAFNDMADRIGKQIEDHEVVLAEVSHELRTPLGHLRLLAELLKNEHGDSRHLRGLESEVETLDFLVDQLLAKSRLDFQMERTEILSVSDLIGVAAGSTGVSSDLLSVDDEATTRGDAMLLRSALANLLRNAELHGEGVSKVCVRSTEDWVFVDIEDAGPGKADDLEQLRGAFVRGDDDSKGLGLGLNLVQRIVTAHHGELEFSDGESGLRATLKLPRHNA